MKNKSIILNVLFIIILICLIYFFIYLNNSNFENFENVGFGKEELVKDKEVANVEIDQLESSVSSPTDLENDIIVNNGLTFDRPLKNANFAYILQETAENSSFKPKFVDGYYWINIQDVGTKYIYCIMDKKFKGGGWMLAMRSVYGSKTFSYNSKHFTKPTTLNDNNKYINENIIKNLKESDFAISSIGEKIYDRKNIDPNKYDAKFDTFNYTGATEWMAIFYVKDKDGNIIKGGDIPNNTRGWVWYEKNVKIDAIDNFNKKFQKIVSPIELFKFLDDNGQRKISTIPAQNTIKFSNAKNRNTPITNIIFSSQPISQYNTSFYGLNYNTGRKVSKMRWGFSFNDKRDKNNDAFGGIGTSYIENFNSPTKEGSDEGYSAGNFETRDDPTAEFLDRPPVELRETSYAIEWYVRELATNCS